MFYVLIMLVLFYTSLIEASFRGYEYNQDIDGYLQLNVGPATFTEARQKCQESGGVLASPVNRAMINAMMYIMSSKMCCDLTSTCSSVLTGIQSIYTKDDFYTIEGKRFSETLIAREPNQCEPFRDCLVLLSNGTITDVDCTLPYPYICYKRNITDNLETCNTHDPGYIFNKNIGSCYKFHKDGQNWTQAAAICAEESGHLAIINSEAEAQYLKELFQLYPANTFVNQLSTIAYIGFLKWPPGSWATIHGQTLDRAGYATWSEGQPDNSGACGAMFRDAQLDDANCSFTVAFICEITPSDFLNSFQISNLNV